jgi:hypothetical protein
MRARHRHFNPASAGASVALDARYGFSLSNNADVDVWSDRSSNNNNATQSIVANRPRYRTNIQGGQPAIEFYPATNISRLMGSNVNTSNVFTAFCLYRMNSGSGSYARVISCTKNNSADYDFSTRVIPLIRNNGGNNNSSWRASPISNIATATLGNWYHFTNTFDGTNCVNRINETINATSASSGNFDINQYSLGLMPFSLENNGALQGFISSVSIFNSFISNSLRKKIQFSNALSFKLACN